MKIVDFFGVNKPKRKKANRTVNGGAWRKTDSQAVRRRNILKANNGDVGATARALQRFAANTNDRQAAVKARQDATYFYNMNRRGK